MSVREIIQHSLEKNPLAMKEALEEEMKARVAAAIEEKMNAVMEEEYDLEEAKDEDDDEDEDDMDESFDLSDLTLEELEDFMMSEDFEQLDEISQDTLRSYIKKASHSSGGSENAINKLKAKSRAHKTLGNDAEAKKYADKAKKRDIGLNRAIARHGARMTGNRVPVKGSPYEKALKKVPHSYFKESFDLSDFTAEELEDFMMSEDFEQLDEISKDLARRYQSAAYADMSKKKDFSNKNRVSGIEMSGRKIQAGGTPHQKTLAKIAGTKVAAT